MAEETQKKKGSDYSEENVITLEWYELSGGAPVCTSAAWATANGRETAFTCS